MPEPVRVKEVQACLFAELSEQVLGFDVQEASEFVIAPLAQAGW